MCVHKTDGTYTLTRVAELNKISFLSIADPDRKLIVGTTVSDPVTVFFGDRPEITVSDGKLVVASKAADSPVEIEIDNVTEIRFDKATSVSSTGEAGGIVCVLQSGAALFRGIPEDAVPEVYTADGRSVPVPPCAGGEMLLSRQKTGSGIFVVRIGTFTTKITL